MIICTFENNRKANLRHVVVDALVIDKDKILLVKRANTLVEANKFALPGGYLDRNETIKEAILREVLEETGYQAKIINLFTIIDTPKRNDKPTPQTPERQNVAFLFLVKPIKKIKIHDHEVSQVKWFSLDKLPPPEDFAFDHYKIIQLFKKHTVTRSRNGINKLFLK